MVEVLLFPDGRLEFPENKIDLNTLSFLPYIHRYGQAQEVLCSFGITG
jgi:hypothetical protein